MTQTHTLADGTETTRPALDWIPRYDPRHHQYPVTALLGDTEQTEPLATIPSRTWKLDARLNQNRQGACVGFAFTHELKAEPSAWQFAPKLPAEPNETAASERFAQLVYWAAQKRDIWPGGEYPGARPVMYGTSLLAAAKVLRGAGYIRQYRWAFTADDAARTIAYNGPAVLGTLWFAGMDNPDPETGLVKISGQQVGGHALVINGYDHAAQQFILTNSWGPDWGVNGTCRIGFDDMDRLLSMRGEICVPVGRTTPRATQ